jgi:hypothetical protein
MALRAATASYQSAAQDGAIANGGNDSAAGTQLGQVTTVAETVAEMMARLAPPEPHLGTNIDIRV